MRRQEKKNNSIELQRMPRLNFKRSTGIFPTYRSELTRLECVVVLTFQYTVVTAKEYERKSTSKETKT